VRVVWHTLPASYFPIVDDPGDHYDFAANHLFLAGIQF
jgi:hypothetical protein